MASLLTFANAFIFFFGSDPVFSLKFAGSILDSGGRHASLMASSRNDDNGHGVATTLQLREANLVGQKVNYLDSGYSEEGDMGLGDQQMTSCLMKTASGSIYIPGSE